MQTVATFYRLNIIINITFSQQLFPLRKVVRSTFKSQYLLCKYFVKSNLLCSDNNHYNNLSMIQFLPANHNFSFLIFTVSSFFRLLASYVRWWFSWKLFTGVCISNCELENVYYIMFLTIHNNVKFEPLLISS
jgi:hypothetical protein